MDIFTLKAAKSLRKSFKMTPNGITKENYPLIKRFSSTKHQVKTIKALEMLIKSTAKNGGCLLKGTLSRDLANESRAGSTFSTELTHFCVLDLDDSLEKSPKIFLKKHKITASCVVQYSASSGMNPNLNCHLFFLLDKPTLPAALKLYVQSLNLQFPEVLTLNKAETTMHFPIDVTVNQNDKLLYVANPAFIGMKDPFKEKRIYIHKGKKDTLSVPTLDHLEIETKLRERYAELRAAAGLPKRISSVISKHGMSNIIKEAGALQITEMKTERNHVYFNINGGDSWAYFHHIDNPHVICNFKDEPKMLTAQVFPEYFKSLTDDQLQQSGCFKAAEDDSDIHHLIFIDKARSVFCRGTFNAKLDEINIVESTSKYFVDNYIMDNNLPEMQKIPEWTQINDPHVAETVNKKQRVLNLFKKPFYMKEHNQKEGAFPNITKLLRNLFGQGEEYDHFINWLAVIFQHKTKTKTAWVLNGTYGTGKGTLISVLKKLLEGTFAQARASELTDRFNSYLDGKFVCVFDEAAADLFVNNPQVDTDLRNYITEPQITIRKMHTNAFEIESYVNLIFNSNSNQPLSIPERDRRFNATPYVKTKLELSEADYDACTLPKELSAFAYHLQNTPCDIKQARTTLENENKISIQNRSTTSVDELCGAILDGNLSVLLDAVPDVRTLNTPSATVGLAAVYVDLIKDICGHLLDHPGSSKVLTRDDLAIIFRHCVGTVPQGASKFKKYLEHHGIALTRLQGKFGMRVAFKTTPEDIPIMEALM